MRDFLKRPENWLAVIAIIFAVIQFVDTRVQEHHMVTIRNSMSTQGIGGFPKNMGAITYVMTDANKELDVMVDFVGYGFYSNPDGFNTYFQTLLSKGRNLKGGVRMIIYAAKPAAHNQASQFGFNPDKNQTKIDAAKKRAEEENWKKESNSDRFNYFFKVIHKGGHVPQNQEEFDRALTEYQQDYRKNLCDAGVQIKTIGHELLFFLWLQDDESAAFSFRDPNAPETEVTMQTRDRNLIGPMHKIFVQSWNNGEDATPVCNASEHAKLN